jgi:hypothetical protein
MWTPWGSNDDDADDEGCSGHHLEPAGCVDGQIRVDSDFTPSERDETGYIVEYDEGVGVWAERPHRCVHDGCDYEEYREEKLFRIGEGDGMAAAFLATLRGDVETHDEFYTAAQGASGRPEDDCECEECDCPLHTYEDDDVCVWCRNDSHEVSD